MKPLAPLLVAGTTNVRKHAELLLKDAWNTIGLFAGEESKASPGGAFEEALGKMYIEKNREMV
jgi:hypothetical protein